jgi:hypothetical protein
MLRCPMIIGFYEIAALTCISERAFSQCESPGSGLTHQGSRLPRSAAR